VSREEGEGVGEGEERGGLPQTTNLTTARPRPIPATPSLSPSPCRCIYTYDAAHPVGGRPFAEEDAPNYVGSFYSLTKGMVDKLSPVYKHVLTLRLRMPISDDLSHRNFITKISSYAKVINFPNSVTILHDLLPVAITMSQRKLTGVFNFTNPGTISHNEVLDLYREYIDKDFWYENFTEEDQAKVRFKGSRDRERETGAEGTGGHRSNEATAPLTHIPFAFTDAPTSQILKAGRCNNHLDTTKLEVTMRRDERSKVKSTVLLRIGLRPHLSLLSHSHLTPPFPYAPTQSHPSPHLRSRLSRT
jgi:hypothetical protein